MKYWVFFNYKILFYIYICIECIIYDLFLNWINIVVIMDIRINSKIVIVIIMGILKVENIIEIVLKIIKKVFVKKYKKFFIFLI